MLCEMIKGKNVKILQCLEKTLYENGKGLSYKNIQESQNAFMATMMHAVMAGWEIRQYYR